MCRSDGQEGVQARRLQFVTRSAAGRPSVSTISPCLHRRHSRWDAGPKHLLGDETISCWRGWAAATPMIQLGKTAQHFRTKRRKYQTFSLAFVLVSETVTDPEGLVLSNQEFSLWRYKTMKNIIKHVNEYQSCNIYNWPASSQWRGHLVFVWTVQLGLHLIDFCFFKLQLWLQRLNLNTENVC